jgi:lipoprotein-anchoring transpeptidase ErfK/SrfK
MRDKPRERSEIMRIGVRRWLAGAASAVALGALALSQAGTTGAATATAHLAGTPGAAYQPAGQNLTLGSHGPAVKALQRRLNFLHYYVGKVDGEFGWSTMEGVWAFKEVQSGKRIPPNPDVVTARTQRQLANPKQPPVLKPHGGASRIEVNKNLEVLVVYRANKPVLISHVSSADATRPDGNGWVTPDGKYRAWEYMPGCVPDATFGGCIYNPVFFIGTSYAIHGMPDPTSTFSYDGVPLNPASHGCVRIPMDVSLVLHTYIRVGPEHGSPVYILGPQALYWP